MPSRYAESTTVSSGQSRLDIETILTKHGASAFGYATQNGRAEIMFDMNGRRIRFAVPLPDRGAAEFVLTPARRNRRTPEAAEQAYEQAIRQRWRALYLVIRAKIEAVEAGITTFNDEFMAHIQLPSGERFGDVATVALDQAYATGTMPALMPGTGS